MLINKTWIRGSVLGVAALMLGSAAQGEFIPGGHMLSPTLTGDTQFDGWLGEYDSTAEKWVSTLAEGDNPGVSSYPGTADWKKNIDSHQGSAGHDAAIVKLANGTSSYAGVYPGSVSLYFSGRSLVPNAKGASVGISDPTSVLNVANVVFQIEIGEVSPDSVSQPYDFWAGDGNGVTGFPVLNYNGGSQQLAPTTAVVLAREANGGTFTPPVKPGEPEAPAQDLYNNTHLLQWDLSGISGITSFKIQFTAVEHAQVYAMRLDQSDTFQSIPEPATMGLFAGVSALLMLRRRRAV